MPRKAKVADAGEWVGPPPALDIEDGTDDELERWLDSLPIRGQIADRSRFDRDASAYRLAQSDLIRLRRSLGPHLKETAGQPSGAFGRAVRFLVVAKHPRDWRLCGLCQSEGCPGCQWGGYTCV